MSHSEDRPVCYVIAGPNGAGKTTFAVRYLPQVAGCAEFVNADMIAHGLSPFRQEGVRILAGKLLLKRIELLRETRVDFAFETTLSGTGHAGTLQRVKSDGYTVELYYLWIPSAAFSADRVARRVASGGNAVPREAIERRFPRSLKNLVRLYLPLADYAMIWDNSGLEPHRIYERSEGRETVFDDDLWALIKEYGHEGRT